MSVEIPPGVLLAAAGGSIDHHLHLFREWGLDVLALDLRSPARNEEASRTLSKYRPDVTVIDCALDRECGLSFLRWLCHESGISPRPCLVIVEKEEESLPRSGAWSSLIASMAGPVRYRQCMPLLRELRSRGASWWPGEQVKSSSVETPPIPLEPPPRGECRPAVTSSLPDPKARRFPAVSRVTSAWAVLEPERGRSSARGLLGVKVMFVLEDTTLIEALMPALEQFGIEVVVSSNLKAFEGVLVQRPHAVVLQERMRGLDGLALTRVLKHYPPTHRIPLLMILDTPDPGSMERSRSAGATGSLSLPLDAAELLRTLRSVIQPVPAERGRMR